LDSKLVDPRESFVDELIAIGAHEKRLVVLDADVSRTSRTRRFRDTYPERFYDCGVAEQNMLGIAAGLAATGRIPVTVTFAVFTSMRAAEQVRTSICYPRLNVKIIGGYAGLSNGKDGATHQSLEDIAIMRSFPNLVVLAASDGIMARKIIKASVGYQGPVYIRLEYENTPLIYDEDFAFEIGRGYKLRQGKDITIISYGIALARALEAARILAAENIEAEVIDMPTIKPLDEQIVIESVLKTGAVITVEDHNIIGGLGAAISQCLINKRISPHFRSLGISDTYTESGKNEEVRVKYGIGQDDIVRAARELTERTQGGARK
jgi:transketolase